MPIVEKIRFRLPSVVGNGEKGVIQRARRIPNSGGDWNEAQGSKKYPEASGILASVEGRLHAFPRVEAKCVPAGTLSVKLEGVCLLVLVVDRLYLFAIHFHGNAVRSIDVRSPYEAKCAGVGFPFQEQHIDRDVSIEVCPRYVLLERVETVHTPIRVGRHCGKTADHLLIEPGHTRRSQPFED